MVDDTDHLSNGCSIAVSGNPGQQKAKVSELPKFRRPVCTDDFSMIACQSLLLMIRALYLEYLIYIQIMTYLFICILYVTKLSLLKISTKRIYRIKLRNLYVTRFENRHSSHALRI